MKLWTTLALGTLLFAYGSPVTADAGDPARAVASRTATLLEASYVYPSRAREAGTVLRNNGAAGRYDGLAGDDLAMHITGDIRDVLHDKHVNVSYSAEVNPPERHGVATLTPEQRAANVRRARQSGYGLGRVAHLPGNVGYIDVRGFPAAGDELNEVFDGAANAVAFSDAVVLDLRRNHGGSPDSIARLLSHFLPPKTHLNDFVGRGDGAEKVEDSTYTAQVPGPAIRVPLYVLISNETFSGGEECAYDVQGLKRGTLIGATTGGGANPGGTQRIDDHFLIFIPTQRARNPITKTNWEGVGVKPDIDVARERALTTAYAMALDMKLRDTSVSSGARTAYSQLRTKLDTMTDSDIFAL
jgi:C-terminal processing protease CtpA/Prc